MAKYSTEELRQMGLEGALPQHVAIIMDGNGRWAKRRGMPRVLGHRAGVERLKGIIRLSSDVGVQALSLYAFSTENWRRPQDEVGALCGLLVEYFNKEIDELHENRVCIRALGDIAPFPESVRTTVRRAEKRTCENKGLKLNIALNYGGQDELLRAAQKIAEEVVEGRLQPAQIGQEHIQEHLDTKGLPDVDLLIRTGGEMRLSNFLLYQAAYAELLFLEEYWPEYTDEKYLNSLRAYLGRTRRFGGL